MSDAYSSMPLAISAKNGLWRSLRRIPTVLVRVAGELPRDRVRPVAEPPRGGEHELAPVRADLVAPAHDERHERARDPGFASDVLHRHVRAASRLARRHLAHRHGRGLFQLERANERLALERDNR